VESEVGLRGIQSRFNSYESPQQDDVVMDRFGFKGARYTAPHVADSGVSNAPGRKPVIAAPLCCIRAAAYEAFETVQGKEK
jgi:hypothetical protein